MLKSKIIVLMFFTAILTVLINGCEQSEHEQDVSEVQTSEQDEHSGETHEESEEEIHLTEDQIEQLGIQVDSLKTGSASSVISRPATVMYDLDRIARVGPRVEANVVRVLKDLGDNVAPDEPIVLLTSVELGSIKSDYIRQKAVMRKEEAHVHRERNLYEENISSQAELLQAELEFEEARSELDAISEALRLYGLSKKEIEQIEAGSEQPLSYFYLSSPLGGRIQQRNISPGQTISAGETPIQLIDLSTLWVMIDGFEQDVPYLKDGLNVELTVRSIPNETFHGETTWVSYSLESDSRTMPVRAKVANKESLLRAGMFGTARIYTDSDVNTMFISVDAVQVIEGEDIIFVPGGEAGCFKPVPVVLGNENEGFVEILEGVNQGDMVVISGAFDLKSALTAASRSADHSH